MNRVARVERLTHETQIVVGTRPGRNRRGGGRHRRAVLRPHAGPAGQARQRSTSRCGPRATSRSTRTTPSRTRRSRSARRSREALGDKSGIRRFGDATGPAGRDAGAGRGRPVRAARTWCTDEPDGMAPLIGTYDTHADQAHLRVARVRGRDLPAHARVEGRNPHHIVEAQFKAFARALRAAAAPDPRCLASPAPRACSARCRRSGGARLRVGEPALGAARAGTGRRAGRGDRGP